MHQLEHKFVTLAEVKAVDETGTFSGYGAMFGNVDSYGDVIQQGAFKNSLKEWGGRGKFPPMLLQHGGMGVMADDMLPVGEWTEMSENSDGLMVEGRLFAMNTERGQYIYEGLKAGVLDGLSIGYQTVGVEYGDGKKSPERTLTEIKLWEVSIVTFPANPKARVTGVKNWTPEELRDLETALRREGLSRTDAERAVWGFRKWQLGAPAAPDTAHREDVAPDELAQAADDVLAKLCRSLLKA